MKIPEMVNIGLEVVDVILRADAEYVPSSIFEKYIDCSESSLKTVLFRMTKAGLLVTKMGPTGGYKCKKPFNLTSLFKVLSPSSLKTDKEKTCNERVNLFVDRVKEQMELCFVYRL